MAGLFFFESQLVRKGNNMCGASAVPKYYMCEAKQYGNNCLKCTR